MFSIIVAISKGGVIGKDNSLPWNISEDLKYFKETTKGKTIIMGRKTFESIGRPLPNRRNIVLSRSKDIEGIETYKDIEEMRKNISDVEEVFVIGGSGVYHQFLDANLVDKLYITEIFDEYEGDTYFPKYDKSNFQEISRIHGKGNYDFVIYEKK